MIHDLAPVIVLDGERPAGLGVVRSLGKRGIPVVVGASRTGTIAARSRYASRSFVYPHPATSPAEFRRAVLGVIQTDGKAALIVPVTQEACAALAAGHKEFEGQSRLALPADDTLAVVLSTSGTRRLAGRLGIPTVPGVEARTVVAGLVAAAEIGFPLVVTPDSRVSGAGARYAADRAELVRCMTAILRRGSAYLAPPLQGEGVGLAVLCRAGAVLWAFQYRRLHELGPAAGVSAYRVSELVDLALLEHAERLMGELSWDGAAELHFSREATEFRLTKVNATFADAISVAVAAGADAPGYLYDLEVQGRKDFPERYRIGARCRHLPSELEWARQFVWPRTSLPRSFPRPSASRILADLGSALSPWHRWDTQSISDVRPGVQELREVSADVWQAATRRLARVWQRRRMRLAARHPDALARRLAAARTVLFVCLGNIIRSAFAAALLRARRREVRGLRIDSAGLDAATDHRADPTAVQRARRFGVDLTAHRTRRVDEAAMAEADVVLAMEIDHIVELCRRFPQHRHKVYLFGCLVEDAHDVADPLYASDEVFDACFDKIDRGIRRMVKMLDVGSAVPSAPHGVGS